MPYKYKRTIEINEAPPLDPHDPHGRRANDLHIEFEGGGKLEVADLVSPDKANRMETTGCSVHLDLNGDSWGGVNHMIFHFASDDNDLKAVTVKWTLDGVPFQDANFS